MFFKNLLHKPKTIFLFFLFFILLYSLVSSSYSVIWQFLLAAHDDIILFSDFRCVQQWGGLYKFFFSESSIVYSHITDCRLNHPRLWILLSKLFFLENEYFFLFFIINFILIYILIFFYSIKKFKSFFLLSKTSNSPKKITSLYKTNIPKFLKYIKISKKFKFIRCDLSKELSNKISSKFDIIFHCAGYAQPSKFISDPIATLCLNSFAIDNLLKRIVYKGNFIFFVDFPVNFILEIIVCR